MPNDAQVADLVCSNQTQFAQCACKRIFIFKFVSFWTKNLRRLSCCYWCFRLSVLTYFQQIPFPKQIFGHFFPPKRCKGGWASKQASQSASRWGSFLLMSIKWGGGEQIVAIFCCGPFFTFWNKIFFFFFLTFSHFENVKNFLQNDNDVLMLFGNNCISAFCICFDAVWKIVLVSNFIFAIFRHRFFFSVSYGGIRTRQPFHVEFVNDLLIIKPEANLIQIYASRYMQRVFIISM